MKTLLHNSLCKNYEYRHFLFNNEIYSRGAMKGTIYIRDKKYDSSFLCLNINKNTMTNFFKREKWYRKQILKKMKLKNYDYLKYEWQELKANEDETS